MNLQEKTRIALSLLSVVILITLTGAFFIAHSVSARSFGTVVDPEIRFTKIPPLSGGPGRLDTIAGDVSGVDVKACNCSIVIYSQTDQLYVQPRIDAPFTKLQADNTFEAEIHLGFRYYALLVKNSYHPSATLSEAPSVGGDVIAATSVKAVAEQEKAASTIALARIIKFSGREWKVKASGDQAVGPGPNRFSDSQENVWVDAKGKLHLRITHRNGQWLCSEVILNEEHAYGEYSFTLDTPPNNIAQALNVVLGAFIWNDDNAHNHCEIDFELSPWGQRNNKLAQFVIQPYTNPRNIARFNLPATLAPSTHIFVWGPGRVECASFKSSRTRQDAFFRHTFTQGIPPNTVGTNARINLWLFEGKPPADNQELEIVISRFDFKPLP